MEELVLRIKGENREEFKYALQEALKQLEEGNTSGSLINEDLEGEWVLSELK